MLGDFSIKVKRRGALWFGVLIKTGGELSKRINVLYRGLE